MSGASFGPEDGEDWLVVVDAQFIFADPTTSPWGSPMWAETVPRIADLTRAYRPERTVLTRFVARPDLGGSWGPYYEEWPFALVPEDDDLYALVPDLVGRGEHVVTAGTFGKWNDDLRAIVGEQPALTLAGVSTDCCVISTALPAADAGATVRVVADACAGSTEDNHAHALAVMALFGPQVTVV
ncbi:MAG: cysteine hydrolase [Dermatophilaceae bacterium]